MPKPKTIKRTKKTLKATRLEVITLKHSRKLLMVLIIGLFASVAAYFTLYSTAATTTTIPYASTCPAPEPRVEYGSRGNCVKKLQSMLNMVQRTKLVVDGRFGPSTDSVVMKFQSSKGLYVDGIVGTKTWAALHRTVNPPPPTPIGGTKRIVDTTGFGWPDNDPPNSAAIAYPVVHKQAGGTGTFSDPITIATKKLAMFPVGVKIYVPYLKKYVIKEDLCGACSDRGIDIWVGGQGGIKSKVLECENRITKRGVEVIFNPPNGHVVSPKPIFNSSTNTCII